jgi:hypothetical protein
MVLVKTPVFRGDDRVLQIGRDLTEGNESVALTIRRRLKQALQPTLGLHRGGWWIDPPGSEKEQRGEQPQKPHTDAEPWKKRSEEILRGPGVYLGFAHLPES